MKQLRYLLVLSLVGGTLSLSQSQDAPPSPWAEEAVRILVAKGVFIGYPDGSFRWREPMTRQEAALALYRLLAAYGLDRLSPEEVDRLLKGVEALQKDLEAQARSLAALKEEKEALETRVRELEAKPGADPEALEALRKEKDDLARRVQALEEALKVLEAAQKALEAKRLEENLKGTEASLKTLEEALRRLEEALKDLPEATRLAQEAQDRLQALEPRLQRAEEGLEALENRVRSLEERLKALEAAQAQDQARLKALEEEVAALKRALTPSRLPLHLGLALYQGDVQRDWHGRLFLGHDALIGPLGLRLAYEAPFAEPAQGLASLDLTFRASYGDLDGYFGVGGGLYLGGPSFGQLLVGAGFRLVPHLSLFLEGHQRYLFDSQASQRSTIAFGLALRL